MPEERASKTMGELKAPIGPNTAHLCIDMQRLFSDEGPWPMAWMPRVTPKVEQLVERAPKRTIFTHFIPPQHPKDAPGRWRAYYEKWSHVTTTGLSTSCLFSLVLRLPRRYLTKPCFRVRQPTAP
jgi:nicotinamidase-related amidase